jgi:hypothetical protein
VEAKFLEIYTDLAKHRDVVRAAGNALLAEGYRANTQSQFFKAIATRARSNLQTSRANSTNEPDIDPATFSEREMASRKEAARLYPDIATPGTRIYDRVGQERAILGRIFPSYFKNPEWPMMLTNHCIALMVFEAQEKAAQQAAQSTMTLEQARQAQELRNLQLQGQIMEGQRDQQFLDWIKQLEAMSNNPRRR